jgi:glucosamine-6-phosphate isomerase
MKVNVFDTYEQMSKATAEFIIEAVRENPSSVICLASGDTPTGTLKNLVQAAKEGRVNFSGCKFVGLDEWVGMDKNDPGSCSNYVFSNFFDALNISKKKIVFFDAKAENLEKECEKVDKFLEDEGQLDIVLVGVGVNGHIGLNEPGVSAKLRSHVVDLEQSTKDVAKKYFTGKFQLEKGITLGLRHIMDSRSVLVIANGPKKSDIIKKIIEGPVTEQVPGSILQSHPDCHFFLDRIAAEKLKTI